MGEIAEALRRARQERAEDETPARESAAPPAPQQDVYSTSARIHEQERRPEEAAEKASPEAREPSPPAPRPAPAASTPARAGSTGGPVPSVDDDTAVRLTHAGVEAQTAQGVLVDDGGAVTDSCLQLALRVRKSLLEQDARTLVVVSALRNEGKTTVSCNLALAMASLSQVARVALVDLDLRRPSLATVLELPQPGAGIEDVIAGRAPLGAARVAVQSPRLDVYPCVHGRAKAHELLLLSTFEDTVARLRDEYDVVIFDSPPSLLVPDASIIMHHVECFAPIARAGITRSRNFRKMLDLLPKRRMLGAILDGGELSVRRGYYSHYGVESGEDAREAADGA